MAYGQKTSSCDPLNTSFLRVHNLAIVCNGAKIQKTYRHEILTFDSTWSTPCNWLSWYQAFMRFNKFLSDGPANALSTSSSDVTCLLPKNVPVWYRTGIPASQPFCLVSSKASKTQRSAAHVIILMVYICRLLEEEINLQDMVSLLSASVKVCPPSGDLCK